MHLQGGRDSRLAPGDLLHLPALREVSMDEDEHEGGGEREGEAGGALPSEHRAATGQLQKGGCSTLPCAALQSAVHSPEGHGMHAPPWPPAAAVLGSSRA